MIQFEERNIRRFTPSTQVQSTTTPQETASGESSTPVKPQADLFLILFWFLLTPFARINSQFFLNLKFF